MVDLKKMTKKQRAEYIWDYYKLHIIAAIFLIVIVSTFTYQLFTKKEPFINFSIMSERFDLTKKDELANTLSDFLLSKNRGREEVVVDAYPLTKDATGNESLDVQSSQKFTVEVSVGEVDAVVVDKGYFESASKNGAFTRLDTMKKLKLPSEGLLTSKVTSDTETTEGIYGISVDNNKILKSAGFNTDNKVLCIMTTSKKKDYAVKLVNWLITSSK